ncbi:protein misato homolog 1 [Alosa sapidissima]|uniref:protein misato homolog 1 n=1 Tax=Alosa sapidissima TaxID=34773 RepID=UPI001C0902BD|nr:protein misato homolog 1 [Alosa sapidissima]
MSLCREVITLQLGHYSNFVGTHWWNLQDASLCYDLDGSPGELQSDVMFREGVTHGGQVTYTPRLIAMDLKGSLQTLRQEGILYETENHAGAFSWKGQVVTHKHTLPTKNAFLQDLDKLDNEEILTEADLHSSQQAQYSGAIPIQTVNSSLEHSKRVYSLEGNVRVWSDFLRLHLHPRTISVIHQYNHDGESDRLEAFGQGEALCKGPVLDELEDKLHFFIEECDYLQGFQVLCDLSDGFSGLGSKVTELLQDSYGGRGILTWGLSPVSHANSTPVREHCHLLNCALGMIHMANHSSFFCPLTLRGGLGPRPTATPDFTHLNYDPTLWYHSSSLLALALDTMTVSYRLRQHSNPMWQLADALAVSGRKVVSAYGAIPFPVVHGTHLSEAFDTFADALPWKPLSACPELGNGCCYGQSVALRGLERKCMVRPQVPGTQPLLDYPCSGEDILASWIQSHYPASPMAVQIVSSASKLTPPFPQIFNKSVSPQGLLQKQVPSTSAVAPPVVSVPVLTSLQSSPAIGPWLSELHIAASRLDPHRIASSFLTHGPEPSDLQEALEQLRVLAHCYHNENSGLFHSSSEDDDND